MLRSTPPPRLPPWLLLAPLLAACKERPAPPPPSATTVPPDSATPPPAPAPSAPARRDEPAQPLQLLRFTFASEVKAKEPVDSLDTAEPGKRVYAHMAFKNPNHEPRTLHVVFRVNGERRTMLDLKIDPSPSYRTWAFNTLKAGDQSGQLALEVTDEAGQTVLSEKLPIKARKSKLATCSCTPPRSPLRPPRAWSLASSPRRRPGGWRSGAPRSR